MTTRTRSALLVSLATVALVAAGCGSDDATTSSSSPTTVAAATTIAVATTAATTAGSAAGPDAQLCAARESLRTSVQGVATAVTGIVSTGTAGVQTALDQVKTDLATVKQQAKSDLAPQVTATETALTGLQTAVSSGGVAGIVAAGTVFAASAKTLVDGLSALKCS